MVGIATIRTKTELNTNYTIRVQSTENTYEDDSILDAENLVDEEYIPKSDMPSIRLFISHSPINTTSSIEKELSNPLFQIKNTENLHAKFCSNEEFQITCNSEVKSDVTELTKDILTNLQVNRINIKIDEASLVLEESEDLIFSPVKESFKIVLPLTIKEKKVFESFFDDDEIVYFDE